jgi:hypothetical protein
VAWDCQAYGAGADAFGARCFFAEPGERLCTAEGECRTRMAAERVRVFERIHALAADGDPVGQYLAAEFTHPDQLLNRPQDTE